MSVVKAEKREIFGTSEARRLKAKGMIPAIIYSKAGNINLSLNGREFEKELSSKDLYSSVVELDFGSKKVKVIAHKIELDPVSDRPVHVDFFGYDESQFIVAKPKIIFTNKEKSPGLKKGGFLHVNKRRVEVQCKKDVAVPTSIEFDIGSSHLGTKIRANDLTLPNGVELTEKGNFLIASVIGRGKSEDEAATTAAPAAGAAAPAAAASATKDAAKK